MKRIILSLAIVAAFVSCSKDSGNNNDKNQGKENNTTPITLAQYLLENGYDTNGNKTLENTELGKITELNVAGKNLKSLEIEVLRYMTNLTSLDASDNKLVSVEFPSQSEKITKLNLSNNQLIKLDISLCKNLDSFDARENEGLACVRVSNNHMNYVNLWLRDTTTSFDTNCTNNSIGNTSVSLINYLINNGYDTNKNGTMESSEYEAIRELNLSNKKITDIIGLDKLTNLEILDLSKNLLSGDLKFALPLLTSLNISANENITLVDISESKYLSGGGSSFNSRDCFNLTCIKANSNQQFAFKQWPNLWRKMNETPYCNN